MKKLKTVALFLTIITLSFIPNNSASAAYFFLDDASSSYEGQSTSNYVVPVSYNTWTSSSSNLFKTYLICPLISTDYGDEELFVDGCDTFDTNSGFTDCTYVCHFEKDISTASRLIYPGANNVSCLIYNQQEGVQFCSSSARINYTGDIFPIYRFWSNSGQHHFYTIEHTEKRQVMEKYDENTWKYEQIAWSAKKFNGVACEAGFSPVFRFWSDTYKGHFYTISSDEKNMIQGKYPSNVWRYEGVAYCTSPYTGSCPSGQSPVYRFWSDQKRGHFFTFSESEKNHIQSTYPSNVWRYEGVAFCGYY